MSNDRRAANAVGYVLFNGCHHRVWGTDPDPASSARWSSAWSRPLDARYRTLVPSPVFPRPPASCARPTAVSRSNQASNRTAPAARPDLFRGEFNRVRSNSNPTPNGVSAHDRVSAPQRSSLPLVSPPWQHVAGLGGTLCRSGLHGAANSRSPGRVRSLVLLILRSKALVWAGEGKRCPSQTRAEPSRGRRVSSGGG